MSSPLVSKQPAKTPAKKKQTPKQLALSELGTALKRIKTLSGSATVQEMNAKTFANREELQQKVKDCIVTLAAHGTGKIGEAIRKAQDVHIRAKAVAPSYCKVLAKFIRISMKDRIEHIEEIAWSKVELPEAYKNIGTGLKALVHAYKGVCSGFETRTENGSVNLTGVLSAFMLDKAESSAVIRKASARLADKG
jgi:hypothetical protein